MKKLVFVFIASTFLINGIAQDQNYYQSMGKCLQNYATAQTIADWQSIANQFDRISNVEKREWLPLYYAAQSTIFMAFQEQDKSKIDAYLDQAQKYIDKALEIKKDESEISVIQAMLYQARINVDMMGRGMQYSMKANECLEQAKEFNAENPRIYYLQAQNIFYTPEQFGGGKKNALPIFQQAKEKFDKFVPASQLAPNWGKEQNEQQLALCLQ
jgi:hypothetical protein